MPLTKNVDVISVDVGLFVPCDRPHRKRASVVMQSRPRLSGRMVEPSERNTASSLMAAFLGLGLCLGAALSNGTIKII